jgi:hypothetical protein
MTPQGPLSPAPLPNCGSASTNGQEQRAIETGKFDNRVDRHVSLRLYARGEPQCVETEPIALAAPCTSAQGVLDRRMDIAIDRGPDGREAFVERKAFRNRRIERRMRTPTTVLNNEISDGRFERSITTCPREAGAISKSVWIDPPRKLNSGLRVMPGNRQVIDVLLARDRTGKVVGKIALVLEDRSRDDIG